MRQEDYNEMMRLPGEATKSQVIWNKCPVCKENYCGNGIDKCIDCERSLTTKHIYGSNK